LLFLLGIKNTRSTPFQPQFNGIVEHQHQTITNYLAKFVSENWRDWDRWVGLCLIAYRSARHETTKISPAEMCFGGELKLRLDLFCGTSPQEPKFLENNYVSQLRKKLDLIHKGVGQQLDWSQKVKTLHAKLDDYYLNQDRRIGCSIFEELKRKLSSYKIMGRTLWSCQKIKRYCILHSKIK